MADPQTEMLQAELALLQAENAQLRAELDLRRTRRRDATRRAGTARMASMNAEQRRQFARQGARARWGKTQVEEGGDG